MSLFLMKWVHTVFILYFYKLLLRNKYKVHGTVNVPCHFFLLCCVQSSVTGKRWSPLLRRNLRTSTWVWLHRADTPTFGRVGPGAELSISWDSMLPRIPHQDYLLSADKSLYSLSSPIFCFMESYFLNSSKLQTSTNLSILQENLTGSHCFLFLYYPVMKLLIQLKLCDKPFFFSSPRHFLPTAPPLSTFSSFYCGYPVLVPVACVGVTCCFPTGYTRAMWGAGLSLGRLWGIRAFEQHTGNGAFVSW